MRRLSRAGFKKDFVSKVLLPDWWEPACAEDPDLLPEIEIRVARFLGMPVSEVANPRGALAHRAYAGAHLRRVRDIDRDRLSPAIHAALQIAGAVVRNMKPEAVLPRPLPPTGLEWREEIKRPGDRVSLDDLLGDVWSRGIPVIPIDELPAPSFQGLAAVVEGRPALVLGHRHDEPGRVAFLIAHEAGHIAAGDCDADVPVVDQDEEIAADSEMERLADQFATEVLVGDGEVPRITQTRFKDFRHLAREAARLEQERGADAGVVIFAWARSTGDFPTAVMATKALYRASGARGRVRAAFEEAVNVAEAPESDRELLRSVLPEAQDRYAPPG